MNSFTLESLVYLVAAGVYLVLRRQADAHRREIALECIRIGITLPPARPRIEMLEALLTTTIGLILSGAGGMCAVLFLGDLAVVRITPPGVWIFLAVLLAGGLTLVILGGRAVRDNVRHAGVERGRDAAPSTGTHAGQ